MKAISCILLAGLLILPFDASACRLMLSPAATFLPADLDHSGLLPGPPQVRVFSVSRNLGGSCFADSLLVFAVPADGYTRDRAYKFETVSGSPPGPRFATKPLKGRESDGKLLFVLHWSELTAPPIDIQIQVTAYSRYGGRGESTTVRIVHPGRSEEPGQS
jgi:hypothetical protein